ncbi:Pleckstrin homology domain [Popillia japonica]|uniref:Pleckstrin homology domain n=1 Tax=Popillia japonica TaxID=7064 RepID=A0AAW1L7H9_POPJA
MSTELGHSIDDVENLIKKHEAFEKSAAAQEERFSALERLTTFELRELKRRQEAAEAEERAKREAEEAERKAALEAAQAAAAEADRPDAPSPTEEEKPATEPAIVEEPKPTVVATPVQSPVQIKAHTTPRPVEKESRRKDRSRSKSPFRSFRWKKSPKYSGASDDEATHHSEQVSPTDEEPALEGLLTRKHEWESTTLKSTNRSWIAMYCVLKGTQLHFYKDAKSAKAQPEQTLKGEQPLNLLGASATVANDYKKRKHVFRLKLESGAEFLFQAHDDGEMNNWVARITDIQDAKSAGPSRSQTLPASGQKDDQKRKSFFTLKKN